MIGATSRQILTQLAEDGHVRRPSRLAPDDGDRYGRALTADEAVDRLERGENIVVRHPTVGTVKERSELVDTKGYRMGLEEWEIHDYTKASLLKNAWHGEGVVIGTEHELWQFNEADKLTQIDTSKVMSPVETHVANLFRQFEGGQVESTVLDSPLGINQYYTCIGDHSDKHPGLYDLETRKGGFMGIGTHSDRLTAYEAMKMLVREERPVMVRTKDGHAHVVRNVHNLEGLREMVRIKQIA